MSYNWLITRSTEYSFKSVTAEEKVKSKENTHQRDRVMFT